MGSASANVSIILYKSKTLSNGEHPLMLRVCKNGQRKYVSIGISCPVRLWNDKGQKPRKTHPDHLLIESIIDQKIQEYRTAELEAKNDGKIKSSSELIRSIEKKNADASVIKYFDVIIDRLQSSHQIGNANVYTNTKNSFKNFCSMNEYLFSEIDYTLLTKYENWMRQKKSSESTMSIHFRTLRSLFNLAIKENIIHEKFYPFKKFSITKFKPQPNRRAITKAEVRKIESLKLEPQTEIFEARQIFLFMYYGQGINFVDLAKLKWANIREERIFYKRSKTGKKLKFVILPPLQQILNYWYPITGLENDNYIFPILDVRKHISATQILNRIHKKITQTNSLLKKIGTAAGIHTPLTTYVARHTFATTLKRQGISTAIISEALGHQAESITQSYLKSFEDSIIDDAVRSSL
jgi:site-specific recombinase XerD